MNGLGITRISAHQPELQPRAVYPRLARGRRGWAGRALALVGRRGEGSEQVACDELQEFGERREPLHDGPHIIVDVVRLAVPAVVRAATGSAVPKDVIRTAPTTTARALAAGVVGAVRSGVVRAIGIAVLFLSTGDAGRCLSLRLRVLGSALSQPSAAQLAPTPRRWRWAEGHATGGERLRA